MHERVLKQVHERLTDACRCMVSSNPRTKFTKFGEHLSIGQMPKSQIPLRYPARELLRSRFEAGRRQVRSWFEPICDHSVMEFGFEPVCDRLRAGSRYLGRVEIPRTCTKLVADRFEPASNLSATGSEPASNQLASWIAYWNLAFTATPNRHRRCAPCRVPL